MMTMHHKSFPARILVRVAPNKSNAECNAPDVARFNTVAKIVRSLIGKDAIAKSVYQRRTIIQNVEIVQRCCKSRSSVQNVGRLGIAIENAKYNIGNRVDTNKSAESLPPNRMESFMLDLRCHSQAIGSNHSIFMRRCLLLRLIRACYFYG
jgi:hypothetical protein